MALQSSKKGAVFDLARPERGVRGDWNVFVGYFRGGLGDIGTAPKAYLADSLLTGHCMPGTVWQYTLPLC